MKRIFSVFSLFVFTGVLNAREPLVLPKVVEPVFKTDTLNIIDFGAKADGITLNSEAINKAITQCNAKGGGVVHVPTGLWLTGPITLKSNVNLFVDKAATLLFTKDRSLYPLVEGNWEGIPQMRMQSPISATGQDNIAITGSGIIDGNGDGWRGVKLYQLSPNEWKKLVNSGGVLSNDSATWYPTAQFKKAAAMKNPGAISPEKNAAFYESVHDFLRPNLVVLTRCKKILLEGVTFQNSAAWCLHPLLSEDLTVRNIFVKNPPYAHNGDAIDVESCKNVLIEGSVFDVGDDALCMKSGRDEEGRKRGVPVENVTIRNCTVYAAHGGFVIGSEMSGGARNMNVSNCTFVGTDIGLRFKSTRGRGGVVENIYMDNIFMKDIRAEAILMDMYYMALDPMQSLNKQVKTEERKADVTTPVFKNFSFNNIYCTGAEKAVFIRGLPEMPVSNISFQNMVLQANKAVELIDASSISFKDVKVLSKLVKPVVDITRTSQVSFDKLETSPNADVLFKINDDKSSQIVIKNTAAGNAKQKLVLEGGAKASAVSW